MLVSINTVLITIEPPSFIFCIVYGYFYAAGAGFSGCHRDYMTHKDKNIYYLAIHRKKKIADLWLTGVEFWWDNA